MSNSGPTGSSLSVGNRGWSPKPNTGACSASITRAVGRKGRSTASCAFRPVFRLLSWIGWRAAVNTARDLFLQRTDVVRRSANQPINGHHLTELLSHSALPGLGNHHLNLCFLIEFFYSPWNVTSQGPIPPWLD